MGGAQGKRLMYSGGSLCDGSDSRGDQIGGVTVDVSVALSKLEPEIARPARCCMMRHHATPTPEPLERLIPLPAQSFKAPGSLIAICERHIADGERTIARQEALIAGLKADGHSTTMAERLLETFRGHLRAHRMHRDLILKTIAEGRE
jgi:hypothetical protein